jgi:hypothetical protein
MQLQRYAMRRAGGGWPRDHRCEPPQVLGHGSQNELILGSSWTTKPKPAEPQALQVGEPHLDPLAFTSRLFKGFSASERTGNVSGAFMDVADILRDGSFGQHYGFSGHISQSSLLARYRSVLSSCTVPATRAKPLPAPGSSQRRLSGHIESRHARRCHHRGQQSEFFGSLQRLHHVVASVRQRDEVGSGVLGRKDVGGKVGCADGVADTAEHLAAGSIDDLRNLAFERVAKTIIGGDHVPILDAGLQRRLGRALTEA